MADAKDTLKLSDQEKQALSTSFDMHITSLKRALLKARAEGRAAIADALQLEMNRIADLRDKLTRLL